MYSTCIFCKSPLGRNALIEHFPVGRRIAFDPARGRLWAVCRSCARWNLSPIEDRWEALRECEEAFRSTSLRVSTENIALARTREGLELVFVGAPPRPEFAAWRYGSRFSGRRRRAMARAGVAVALGAPITTVAALFVGPAAMGIPLVAAGAHRHFVRVKDDRRITAVPLPDGRWLHVLRSELPDARLIPSHALRSYELRVLADGEQHDLRGEDAMRAGAMILPALNGAGGSARAVESATRFLDDCGDPEQVFYGAAKLHGHSRPIAVESLPPPVRLAMEMAANENMERQLGALDLSYLEEAWREAEHVAAIADGLVLPSGVIAGLRRIRIRLREQE